MIADDGDVLHEHKRRGRRHLALRLRRKAPIEDWVQLAIDRQKADRLRGDLLAG
jgi:isocitrate dehydrogenase